MIVLNPFLDSLCNFGFKNIGLTPGIPKWYFQHPQDVVNCYFKRKSQKIYFYPSLNSNIENTLMYAVTTHVPFWSHFWAAQQPKTNLCTGHNYGGWFFHYIGSQGRRSHFGSLGNLRPNKFLSSFWQFVVFYCCVWWIFLKLDGF